jgi:hypothetical protein
MLTGQTLEVSNVHSSLTGPSAPIGETTRALPTRDRGTIGGIVVRMASITSSYCFSSRNLVPYLNETSNELDHIENLVGRKNVIDAIR